MRSILLIFIILICSSCYRKDYKEEFQIEGLWYNTLEERVWFLKDSVGYFFNFSPFSKWAVDEDTLKIMDHDHQIIKEFRMIKQSKDSFLVLSKLNNQLENLEFHKIDLESIKNIHGLKNVRLKEFECLGDPDCMLSNINIDFAEGYINLDIGGNVDSYYSTLEKSEANLLYYLFNYIQIDSLKSEYFSNNVGSIYYELQAEFFDTSKNFILIIDSGIIDSVHLNNFISVVWVVSYNSCSQDERLENRILH